MGNHDFDDSVEGFLPFAEQAAYPLLGANIHSTLEDFQEGVHWNRSMVALVRGRLVGIIGYTTRSTEYNFPNHEVAFNDEVEAVRLEAQALKAAGVEIILALGHSGYAIDQVLAREVEELDLVVGGHSHTFLYTRQVVVEGTWPGRTPRSPCPASSGRGGTTPPTSPRRAAGWSPWSRLHPSIITTVTTTIVIPASFITVIPTVASPHPPGRCTATPSTSATSGSGSTPRGSSSPRWRPR